jgi:hypothetical protein
MLLTSQWQNYLKGSMCLNLLAAGSCLIRKCKLATSAHWKKPQLSVSHNIWQSQIRLLQVPAYYWIRNWQNIKNKNVAGDDSSIRRSRVWADLSPSWMSQAGRGCRSLLLRRLPARCFRIGQSKRQHLCVKTDPSQTALTWVSGPGWVPTWSGPVCPRLAQTAGDRCCSS